MKRPRTCKPCGGKRGYSSYILAEIALGGLFACGRENLNIYPCPTKRGIWHIGHVRRTDLNLQAEVS